MILRDYQQEIVDDTISLLEGGECSLAIECATGLGKSAIMAEIARLLLLSQDGDIIVVAQDKNIVQQLLNTIKSHLGADESQVGLEMNVNYSNKFARVIVCSIQTITTERRLAKRNISAIIVDECHHATAKSYKNLFSRFPDAIRIGLSATCFRTNKWLVYSVDERGFAVKLKDKYGEIRPAREDEAPFRRLVTSKPLKWGIEQGWLCDIVTYAVEGVEIKAGVTSGFDGDKGFKSSELDKDMINGIRTGRVIHAYKTHFMGKMAVSFC